MLRWIVTSLEKESDSKDIRPMPIDSKMQVADLLIKGLGTQQLQFLLGKMSIKDLHAPS